MKPLREIDGGWRHRAPQKNELESKEKEKRGGKGWGKVQGKGVGETKEGRGREVMKHQHQIELLNHEIMGESFCETGVRVKYMTLGVGGWGRKTREHEGGRRGRWITKILSLTEVNAMNIFERGEEKRRGGLSSI